MAAERGKKGVNIGRKAAEEMQFYDDFEGLAEDLRLFSAEKNLSDGQVRQLFSGEVAARIIARKDSVPDEIFRSRKLGAYEAIVKYLRENRGMSLARIASMTGRSNKTVWATYRNAARKVPKKFSLTLSGHHIPISILKDRKLGAQEAIVRYLKENEGLGYHRIAVILSRNDRTIWTAYQRARKKSGKSA